MPELPEVEVVRLQLQKHLSAQGKSQEKRSNSPSVILAAAKFFRADLRFPIPKAKILGLVGLPLLSLERHGKYLIFNFGKQRIISHFGMTGTWRYRQTQEKQRLHDHVMLTFLVRGVEKTIIYHDPRRFGFLDFADDKRPSEFLSRLGPDAMLALEIKDLLYEKANVRSTPIKNLLLDQGFIAGVGNIYASEALFLAGIHPTCPAKEVMRKKMNLLLNEVPKLLQSSINAGGSSIDDFHGADQKPGNYQKSFWVYDRENELCLRCQGTIRSLRMGQRSTYYCSRCQK